MIFSLFSRDKKPSGVFEVQTPKEHSEFILRGRVDILYVLRGLLKQGGLLHVYFDNGHAFFLSCLLGLSEENNIIYLDVGRDQAVNRNAAAAKNLVVHGMLEGVKVQFQLDHIEGCNFAGKSAFRAKLPSSLLRLQRREYFRLETRTDAALVCRLGIRHADGAYHTLAAPVLDVSGGGVGLGCSSVHASGFTQGAILKDCRIDFRDEGVLNANLCVKSVHKQKKGSTKNDLRVGCEFVNLPSASVTMVQRFIAKVERERKARQAALEM